MPSEGQNGGQCNLCHLTTNHVVDPAYNPENGPALGTYNPLFTDFTFDNLGIPVNPRAVVLFNSGDNGGISYATDLGLGGQVAQLRAAHPDITDAGIADRRGKFKVSSLRNLSRTAPYGHNGYFATMYDIVHFYNTRDVLGACEAGDVIGVDCWPAAEVPGTVNDVELGDLGLTLQQEQKLVMFLETLTD